MKDEFKYLRSRRHFIFQILSCFNRVIWHFLAVRIWSKVETITKDSCEPAINVLFVYRDFGNSNLNALDNIGLNVRDILRDKLQSKLNIKIRYGNVFLGNAKWLRKQIEEYKPNCLVIGDPQLIGIPGPFGLIQTFLLIRYCRTIHCSISLLLFDLPDPQGSLYGSVISRFGGKVFSICNDQIECLKFSNIVNAEGPALEICFRPKLETRVRSQHRSIEVHLPRPSYSPRKELVEIIAPQLLSNGIKYSTGGNLGTLSEFEDSLNRTKIVVVTNSIISDCVGTWPLPDGPFSHAVSYNFEALRAGALLLSQDCDAVSHLLKDGVEYQSFSDHIDLYRKISFFLNNEDLLDKIAEQGNIKYNQVVCQQSILKSLLNCDDLK